jgi:hypothetical protein
MYKLENPDGKIPMDKIRGIRIMKLTMKDVGRVAQSV